MWAQDEPSAAADYEEDSSLSSEDEVDIQCEFLEKQRDEANQKLAELEEVSNQLLKEMSVLEMQFQVERSCRESAEALALEVTKANKDLKRRSCMVMPLISELPENLHALTFDPEAEPAANGDEVDLGEGEGDGDGEDTLLFEHQAKVTELQVMVDGLLTEKLQLQQQVEELSREQVRLREQLALEVEEKESILRKMSKQTKTVNKLKRVSQLVTEEFTEMSQKLELEQDLRQHAEVFAHQMLEEQKATGRPGETETRRSETDVLLQLQHALQQISQISTALSDIQLYYRQQIRLRSGSAEESAVLSELHGLRGLLGKSEEDRRSLQTRLCEANGAATRLQEEVNHLQDELNKGQNNAGEKVEKSTPLPPPPPPPPPLPPPTPVTVNLGDFLKSRRKDGGSAATQSENSPLLDMKSKAVNEMMERIKKGITLRPISRIQDDDSSWKDHRGENRKSAVVELKGMLDSMKHQRHRRVLPRGIGRTVRDAELLSVLQKRRRVMGENLDQTPATQTQDPRPGGQLVPAASDVSWVGAGGGGGGAPVLRRLRQNRDKRDSCIRASALMISNNI